MKKNILMSLVAVFVIFMASCSYPMGSGSGGETGVATGSGQLPADQVSDQMRSLSGDFTFETLFPVALDLKIDLYGVNEAGMLIEPAFEPGNRSVVVQLSTTDGHPVYSGMVAADGTLRAAVYLPSAPADMYLTVTAEGFESRQISIPRMVEFERVQRRLGLKQATGGIGAAAFTPGLPDRDGDGVPDVYDAFPDDPNSAFVLNVPADGNLTIAFEDLFGRANAGDADYNDFIANYRIQEITNAEGHVTSLRIDATAVEKLAGYNHRFGIRIDDFEGSASLVREYIDESGSTRSQSMTGVTAPVEVELFEHSGRAVGKSAWFTLEFAKAQRQPDSSAPLSEPPYNPWIFVRNTEQGIHLIDREPLTKIYPSNNPHERFVDSDGFPWALLVPEEWVHPAEAQRIDSPQWYPRFTNWRESGGTAFTDWYHYLGNPWVEPETPPTVYVAGYRNDGTRNVAVYWVDNGESITHHALQPGVVGEATDIHVNASGVVRAVGWYRSGSTDMVAYWRNGSLTTLESGGRATGMHVTDTGATYVSGYYNDGSKNVAAYWVINGDTVTQVDLHTTSAARATGIVVDGEGTVFASGYYGNGSHDVAVYWRNDGIGATRVDLYAEALSQANGITVDASRVYVIGRFLDGVVRAAMWVDDAGGLQVLNSQSANAKGVGRSVGVTYVSGDYLGADVIRRAAYWRGPEQVELAGMTSAQPTFANGITLLGDDVYVAGVSRGVGDRAVYWKNGIISELSGGLESQSVSVFVAR